MTKIQSSLTTAAQAARNARAALERIEGQQTRLQEKSRELDELRWKADADRERKAKLLETAALDGRSADTSAIDKQCAASARAWEKRQDEAVGVSRALETLEGQRQEALAALDAATTLYQEARTEHERLITLAGCWVGHFRRALEDARRSVAEMPQQFRERLLSVKVDLAADLLEERAIREIVTAEAVGDLAEADQLAALPPPPDYSNRPVQYASKDGALHSEEEPEPTERPAMIIRVGQVNRVDLPPGMPGVRG